MWAWIIVFHARSAPSCHLCSPEGSLKHINRWFRTRTEIFDSKLRITWLSTFDPETVDTSVTCVCTWFTDEFVSDLLPAFTDQQLCPAVATRVHRSYTESRLGQIRRKQSRKKKSELKEKSEWWSQWNSMSTIVKNELNLDYDSRTDGAKDHGEVVLIQNQQNYATYRSPKVAHTASGALSLRTVDFLLR